MGATGVFANAAMNGTDATGAPAAVQSPGDAIRILHQTGAALASSPDHAIALDKVARIVVPRLADWCAIHLADTDGTVTRLSISNADPAKISLARELHKQSPIDIRAIVGIGEVFRTGRSELYRDAPGELYLPTANNADCFNLLSFVGMQSAVIAPLVARGCVLGVLSLISEDPGRRYGPDDLLLAEEIARQCAVSVENGRLFRDVQAAEARARSLFEAAADGILVFDEEGRYRDVNPAMTALLGQSREELLGKHMGDLATDGAPSARARFERLREAGSLRFEASLRHRDGTEIPIESHATYVTLPDGTLYLAIVRDVSERQRAANEIRTLNEDLERRVIVRTAELDAVNRELEAFSYSVSHDLRAPLRAVDGFSRILVEKYGDQLPDEARRYLKIVRDGTARMGNLIDDLLEFSRLGRQSLRTRAVNPNGLVNDVVSDIRGEVHDRSLEIVVDVLPGCLADPALLKQVYANLLSNAVKYTRDRAHATIHVGALAGERENEHTFFVRDNGVGFDMAYADKLFGVFQRLHRSEDYEGTGVGLALVQRIVHRHGGRIWAEAELDRGATFWFTLPAAPDSQGTAGQIADGADGDKRE